METVKYEMLSEQDMKALPRKVGRMKYEDALHAAREMQTAQDAHKPSACPHCKTIPPWREIDVPCAEMVELQKEVKAWGAQKEHRLNDYDAVNRRNQHRKTCTVCTFKNMYYDGYFSCVYTRQLQERWHIYTKRVSDIEVKQMHSRFAQEQGRAPRDTLEFSEWCDRVGWPTRPL